jgi:hypothetical protein
MFTRNSAAGQHGLVAQGHHHQRHQLLPLQQQQRFAAELQLSQRSGKHVSLMTYVFMYVCMYVCMYVVYCFFMYL